MGTSSEKKMSKMGTNSETKMSKMGASSETKESKNETSSETNESKMGTSSEAKMSKMGTSSYTEIPSSTRSKSQPERTEREMAKQAMTLEWHMKRWGQRSSNLLLPPLPCPAFSSLAVMEDGVSEWVFTSESFTKDYVLLLFLPMDGSVDMTELEAFSDELGQLESLGCQVKNKFFQTKI